MTARLPLLAVAAAALLAIPACGALGDLTVARAARDAARIEASAPAPLLATADAAFPADNAADARAHLGARVRADAARGGVLIETLGADPAAPPALTVLTLRASGSEKAVVAFADMLERARPAIRMQAWRLTAAAGGVRLDATLVAPWRG
ncbi:MULTISPECIES: hypothetical protein [unclassified Sphingomonas]|uniref:hypothetical protein n=1 Tax=unclassified Sphingomonas TaxID=196159 RepID=UPI0006FDAD30|nr:MULTISPECIES: hypothetical protein [unclassified Sphingomonas]KQM61888.1 hypothetical protein ASE65_06725 [Sphingomonas sp. Leaf16]KQN13161.1 hypothetical protein ASE81_07740 [Sphingomonas sp. Leaf29]KQN20046.1 hypothetical protein ASE83_07665 [Sphingomonas sp. Leaf32]